jgi:hypothetical protein
MRMGQTTHVGAIEAYCAASRQRFVTARELARERRGVALTGDVGEMSRWELFTRTVWS